MLSLLLFFNVSFAQEWVPKIWPLQFGPTRVTAIPQNCSCDSAGKPVSCGKFIVCVKTR